MIIAEKLTTIAENEQKVYDAGQEKGYSSGMSQGYSEGYDYGYNHGYEEGQDNSTAYQDGYNDGYSQGTDEGYGYGYQHGQDEAYPRGYTDGHTAGVSEGKQAEYDRFWDAYQSNGKRHDYYYAFAGTRWNDETFKPKYDINMLYSNINAFTYCEVSDITDSLKKCGVSLDTSGANALSSCFAYALTKTLPVIDASNCTTLSGLFSECRKLERIEKVKFPAGVALSSVFKDCKKLTDVTFEGVINRTLNISYSPLSVASMKSLISCLANFSGTENEFKYTLTVSEDCWAALEADSTAPDGNTWKQYVDGLGWNT